MSEVLQGERERQYLLAQLLSKLRVLPMEKVREALDILKETGIISGGSECEQLDVTDEAKSVVGRFDADGLKIVEVRKRPGGDAYEVLNEEGVVFAYGTPEDLLRVTFVEKITEDGLVGRMYEGRKIVGTRRDFYDGRHAYTVVFEDGSDASRHAYLRDWYKETTGAI